MQLPQLLLGLLLQLLLFLICLAAVLLWAGAEVHPVVSQTLATCTGSSKHSKTTLAAELHVFRYSSALIVTRSMTLFAATVLPLAMLTVAWCVQCQALGGSSSSSETVQDNAHQLSSLTVRQQDPSGDHFTPLRKLEFGAADAAALSAKPFQHDKPQNSKRKAVIETANAHSATS